MEFFSGQPTKHNDLRRYVAAGLSLKEYLADPSRLPAVNKLTAQRKSAPEGLRFSVALPGTILEGGAEGEAALVYGLKVVRAVDPDWVILKSRPDFRPGRRSEDLLRATVQRIKDATQEKLAWEPRGLWEDGQIRALTDELDVDRVIEPRRVLLPSDVERPVYVRWKLMGAASGVSEFAIEDLAEQIAGRPVYAIAEGNHAPRLLKSLREALRAFDDDDELGASLPEVGGEDHA